MPVSKEFQAFISEQLEGVPQVQFRRMFGGVGIYGEGYFFALIDDDTLFLKVSDATRSDFTARGMSPFSPSPDKPTSMDYFEVPLEVLEDKDELLLWAKRAIAVAKTKPAKRKSGRSLSKNGDERR